MSTPRVDPGLAGLELVRPKGAETPRSPGVYSWWLNTAEFPSPEVAGLTSLPDVPRLSHESPTADLLYVGRARRNLHKRITRQHLRRTRSSALRRTLLAVMLPGDVDWRKGAAFDRRARLILETGAETRLTTWMEQRLLLGWVPCESADEVDTLEKQWIDQHRPVLNAHGTAHGPHLTNLKRVFRGGLRGDFGVMRKDR